MTATIWVDTDKEETLEIGGTIQMYAAFSQMNEAAGGWKLFSTRWPHLSAIVAAAESQNDVGYTWANDLATEADQFLAEFGLDLPNKAVVLLQMIRTAPVVNAFCPTGPGGGVDPTCSPHGATSAESSVSEEFRKIHVAGLKKLKQLGDGIQREIAWKSGISQATTKFLKDNGYIEWTNLPNGKRGFRLTDKGHAEISDTDIKPGPALVPKPSRPTITPETTEATPLSARTNAVGMVPYFSSPTDRTNSQFTKDSITKTDKLLAEHDSKLEPIRKQIADKGSVVAEVATRLDAANKAQREAGDKYFAHFNKPITPQTSREMSDLRNDYHAKTEATEKVRTEYETKQKVLSGECHDILRQESQRAGPVVDKVDLPGKSGITAEAAANVKTAEQFLGGTLTAELSHRVDGNNLEVRTIGKSRASYDSRVVGPNTTGGIPSFLNLASGKYNSSTATAVHEIGHSLEDDLRVHELAVGFLEKRTAGEPATRIPGHPPGEIGRKDQFDKIFDNPSSAMYVGRHYSQAATEVVSMGLEKMYSDPAGFASKDPEYFKLMAGIVTGRLLRSKKS